MGGREFSKDGCGWLRVAVDWRWDGCGPAVVVCFGGCARATHVKRRKESERIGASHVRRVIHNNILLSQALQRENHHRDEEYDKYAHERAHNCGLRTFVPPGTPVQSS